jgi:hypothetical protein
MRRIVKSTVTEAKSSPFIHSKGLKLILLTVTESIGVLDIQSAYVFSKGSPHAC